MVREIVTERDDRSIFAIVGPTAVGKTKISLELARRIDAEIISVDSRQVYRYLDIGTDKISLEERKRIIHHMIDVADPDEVFTVADFVEKTLAAIDRIRGRGRVPLLVGGTPLYYRALEGNLLTDALPSDTQVRRELELFAEEHGRAALHKRLTEIDPVSARRIHPNDLVRTARSLEIFQLSGKRASELYEENKKILTGIKIFYLGINAPREPLYARITERVSEQFHSGYPEEVKWLLDHGFSPELPSMQGFGYRELVKFHMGELTFDEAVAGDVKATKAFARRQMTWFRQFSPIVWYDSAVISGSAIADEMEETVNAGGAPRE